MQGIVGKMLHSIKMSVTVAVASGPDGEPGLRSVLAVAAAAADDFVHDAIAGNGCKHPSYSLIGLVFG